MCYLNREGYGGVSVIRVSGSQSQNIVAKLCPFLPSSCESHKIYYGFIKRLDQTDIDEVLVSYFAQGRSFTGEQTLEISSHGGNFISQNILLELQKVGARVAERGEFTYRSFMNGRIDLTQAEGVLAVIESESYASSQLALKQLKGQLSQTFENIEKRLTYILAHLEADIDFASEDIEYSSGKELLSDALEVQSEINQMLSTYSKGRQIKEGVEIAIIGEPNVGKSSLFNAILGEERAIVSTQAGTTRDCIEERFLIEGVSYYLRDTAGLRESANEIEKMGMSKSLNFAKESDLIFLTLDLSKPLSGDASILETFMKSLLLDVPLENLYFILNKSDLVPKNEISSIVDQQAVNLSKMLRLAHVVS